MWGNETRGRQAKTGDLLLARHGNEPLLMIPLIPTKKEIEDGVDRDCLIFTKGGSGGRGGENSLEADYWDVSDIAHIEPDPTTFDTGKKEGGGRLMLDEDGCFMISISPGEFYILGEEDIPKAGGRAAKLSFRSWRVVTKSGVTLFTWTAP